MVGAGWGGASRTNCNRWYLYRQKMQLCDGPGFILSILVACRCDVSCAEKGLANSGELAHASWPGELRNTYASIADCPTRHASTRATRGSPTNPTSMNVASRHGAYLETDGAEEYQNHICTGAACLNSFAHATQLNHKVVLRSARDIKSPYTANVLSDAVYKIFLCICWQPPGVDTY